VVLFIASGCSPDEQRAVAPAPEPPANRLLGPPRGQVLVSPEEERRIIDLGRLERVGSQNIGDVETRVLTRLVYQCSDEVTFAVRVVGDRLEVFPPGVTNNYVVMQRMPSDSGVRYSAANAEFRANRDLATLQIGSERHVDCVSNPAASVWGAVQPNAPR